MVGGKRKMKTEMELASLSPTISQLRIGHARTGSQNQKIDSATPELLLASVVLLKSISCDLPGCNHAHIALCCF